MMKTSRVTIGHLAWLICAIACLKPVALAQEIYGYLQINSEPGLLVHINGKAAGVTSAEESGKYLKLEPGQYSLKVIKPNFEPFIESIQIKGNDVTEKTVRLNKPKIKISESGESSAGASVAHTGSLLIRTLPTDATIKIPDLQIDATKTRSEWKIDNAPVGTYEVTVIAAAKKVVFTADLKKGELSKYFVHGPEGKHRDLVAEEELARRKRIESAKKTWEDETASARNAFLRADAQLQQLKAFMAANPPKVQTQGNDGSNNLWKARVTLHRPNSAPIAVVLHLRGRNLLTTHKEVSLRITGPHMQPVKHWKGEAEDEKLKEIKSNLEKTEQQAQQHLRLVEERTRKKYPDLNEYFPE